MTRRKISTKRMAAEYSARQSPDVHAAYLVTDRLVDQGLEPATRRRLLSAWLALALEPDRYVHIAEWDLARRAAQAEIKDRDDTAKATRQQAQRMKASKEAALKRTTQAEEARRDLHLEFDQLKRDDPDMRACDVYAAMSLNEENWGNHKTAPSVRTMRKWVSLDRRR